MNGIAPSSPSPDQPMSRDLLLTLLDTALRVGELRYARRLCTSWLAIYPGDLQVNHLYSQALFKEKSSTIQLQALPILEELCKLDPEYHEAQELLAEVRKQASLSNHIIAKACAYALVSGSAVKTGLDERVSSWAKHVYEARTALINVRSGEYQQIDKAEYYIHKALVENRDTPLAAVVHLRLIESKGSMPKLAVRSLAQIYHERWPDCLQFQLTLSKELMDMGETNYAVNMLHQAVSKDICGQVAKRLWGNHHRYASLWPTSLEAKNTGSNSPQNIPVPAAVASIMGWNQIPAIVSGNSLQSIDKEAGLQLNHPEKQKPPEAPTQLMGHSFSINNGGRSTNKPAKVMQSELEKLADDLKRPHLAHEDGRFPIYVVFSTRGGLESHYGSPGFVQIDKELKKLAGAIHGHKLYQEYWGSMLLYADDATSTQAYKLQPARYNDPTQLKLILTQLDKALEKRGERIGAILIVGGPEIVPYHNLSNPVEDADVDVPSDNPYAAKDGNYFISDWPVGRISGGSGKDPADLVTVIQSITNRYGTKESKLDWYFRLIEYILELFRRGVSKRQSSFGYTAAVWRRASLSVFRAIGDVGDLLVSPPTHACECQNSPCTDSASSNSNGNNDNCLLLPPKHLAYFNLHGVPDGSEWYGQIDPTLPEDGPDFPIAMRPQDIKNGGSAPKLVFSEACYGANITGKKVDEAISLKFLASGTHAMIGSTCISYGSLATPLTSADLLGRVFWSLMQEGFTAGEALRRAKIHLTREMHSRQGYLDAEDQKTLISFVLFGDPLAQPFQNKVSPKVTPHLSDSAIFVPTVCEHAYENQPETTVSLETIAHLKSVVAEYLPGMNDAKVSLTQEHQSCSNLCNHRTSGRRCVFSEANAHRGSPVLKRRVVTLSKNFEQAHHIHRQYARLTLDEQGKIVKMVVSH